MLTARTLVAAMLLVAAVATIPVHADSQTTADITIARPSRQPFAISLDELNRLPVVQVNVAFLTEHGTRPATFEGPLLWTVLQKAGVIDPAMHREQVSQTIMIRGRDGYQAVLAVGEIAPEFEGKQVILAKRMDGKPLDPEHLRIVVPLDKRGGRSVRDVVRIEIAAAPALSE